MSLLDKESMRMLGVICFAIGFIILYAIGRRRFKRRTITGSEVFRSYESAWITRLIEGGLRLVGLFLLLGGISAFILSYK